MIINPEDINILNQQIYEYPWDFENKQGVYVGRAGMAIYYALYHQYSGNSLYKDKVYELISDSLNNLDNFRNRESLSGIAGIAWAIQYLVNTSFFKLDDVQEYILNLKSFILESLDNDFRIGNFDLMHGFIGKCLCLLEMIKPQGYKDKEVAKKINESIMALDKISKQSPDGLIFWESTITGGQVYIGMSHGVSGIIWFLSKVRKLGILDIHTQVVCDSLIIQASKWLLSLEVKTVKEGLSFPMNVSKEGISNPRFLLAWCHGDFGVVSALIKAGKSLDNQYLYNEGLRIGKKLAKVRLHNSDILQWDEKIDTSICHGVFGSFLLFYLMYVETKDENFKDAYTYWIDLISNQIINKNRQSIFLGLTNGKLKNDDPIPTWHLNPGLLIGISGNALVLLTYLLKEQGKGENIYWHDLFF